VTWMPPKRIQACVRLALRAGRQCTALGPPAIAGRPEELLPASRRGELSARPGESRKQLKKAIGGYTAVGLGTSVTLGFPSRIGSAATCSGWRRDIMLVVITVVIADITYRVIRAGADSRESPEGARQFYESEMRREEGQLL